MNNYKLLAFVGMSGAGKTRCVNFMVDKNLPIVHFTDITKDEIKARNQEVNDTTLKSVKEDILTKEGEVAYGHRAIEKLNEIVNQGHARAVVDGIISWAEYKFFKEAYGKDIIVVAVVTDRHLRHERLAKRPINPINNVEIMSEEYAAIENQNVGGPIANADFCLINNGTEEDLLKSLDKLLKDAEF